MKPSKQNQIIGILGGMGPQSTIELYQHIVNMTPAQKDQDHLETIIYSYPQIPDRTQGILGERDPFPYLLHGVKLLDNSGADFILIACNTAHAFLPKLKKEVSIPILNMIDETTKYIKANYPNYNKIGLLATNGTIKSGLYQDYIKTNQEIIVPDDQNQTLIMECIYGTHGIKAGFVTSKIREDLERVITHLQNKGAQIIILGCTEISLVINQDHTSLPLINPLIILAKKSLLLAQLSSMEAASLDQ